MKPDNYCHLTIQSHPAEERIVKEARILRATCSQIIIAPGDGGEIVQDGVRIVNYRYRSPLMSVFTSYYLALKMRARVYHLHDPELLILGWCFRLITSGAVIYDAHRPTFHYFLWKFGPAGVLLRLKAALLKLIETIGVIFIDGLIMAAPLSKKGIGRFCHRKIVIRDFPEIESTKIQYPLSPGKVLIYRALMEKPADLNLILETFLQVHLVLPDTRLVLACPVPDGFDPVLVGRLHEIKLEQQVIVADKTGWKQLCRQNTIGLATPNSNEYFQRSEQSEIYEYLALGIPVICGRTAFTEKIVAEKETGIVLKNLTPLNISETVIKLFSDERLSSQMSINARHIYKNDCRWEKNVVELNDFFSGMFPR
ncbi:MAG: glycosyltransferase [Candidatus Marinimicrobia bacterium]|nr:glycosyltransferase [Candidatus Neomarinimicrobiota bacterium]